MKGLNKKKSLDKEIIKLVKEGKLKVGYTKLKGSVKMKFKTKEDLMEDIKDVIIPREAYEIGLDHAFKSFTERIEFYKKYRNDLGFLKKERKTVYSKFIKYIKKNNLHGCKDSTEKEIYGLMYVCGIYTTYNNWLFDYCFGDVVE